MRFGKFLLPLLILPFFSSNALSQKADILPPVKYEEYRLKNGLRVILHQDKSTPVVAVNVWYHVGSKNEVGGKTGFAHLFEHVMFQGAKNYNASFYTPLEEAGASRINGITTSDTTNYFEVMPSNFLELALFMEADRMGGLLEAITQEKLDIQRDVVKNERRENFDNPPYGTWLEKVCAELYPASHPYRWHPIGSMKDISAASLDDVKTFFRQYYVPNNAILSVAGDFDNKKTKQWIEKYFGVITKGTVDITRPNPPQPKLEGEIRRTVEDSVSQPRLYFAWHGVRKYASDEAALEILSRILSTGRSSRLQSNLVIGKQIAQSAFSFTINKELAGLFFIQATPASGKSLDEIEKEINVEIERIKKEPPTPEEMTRALNQIESNKLFDLQTPLTKGDMLGEYALFLNKPDNFQADLDRYRKVTAADVQRVANNYLTANRLVLTYVPRKTAAPATDAEANKSERPKAKENNDDLIAKQTANLPKPGPNPKLSLPPIEKTKLSNGLEVWIVRQNKLPIVSMEMVIKSGVVSEPAEKHGVYAMTAGLLRSGTKTRSALEISNQMQSLGTSVNVFLGWDWTRVGTQVLLKNFDRALDVYSDVVVNPVFPETEVESIRRRTLNVFVQQKSDPKAIANQIYSSAIYGTNPYSRPLFGNEESVKKIFRDDVLKYYRSNFLPNNSVLIVVGDVEKNSLIPRLEKAFSSWKSETVSTTESQAAEPLTKTTIFLMDRPGSAQSTIRIGRLSAARNSPDYYSMQVMNSILGWGLNSRISANLRESKGYAYEAGSDFTYHRTTGQFLAWANVQTAVTKESVAEFMKELNGIRGAIPVTQKELDYNKQSLIRRFPSEFEGVGQISFRLSHLAIYGLSEFYFNDYIQKIDAVTVEDVNRTAGKYLAFDGIAIVIVGDRKTIEPGLKQLGYPIILMDADGNAIQ